jgi:hypothetical protein
LTAWTLTHQTPLVGCSTVTHTAYRPESKSPRRVRLAYQPPASSTFLSGQTSHQQTAISTLLSEQTNTSHQPPAKRPNSLSDHHEDPWDPHPVSTRTHPSASWVRSSESGHRFTSRSSYRPTAAQEPPKAPAPAATRARAHLRLVE